MITYYLARMALGSEARAYVRLRERFRRYCL